MLGIMVVEGFGGSVVGGCGDARDFGAVGLWSSVGVGGDVVGLVCGFSFGVGGGDLRLEEDGRGCVDLSAVVWFVRVLSRRRLSASARRKFSMCVWEKIMDLLVPMQSAAAQVNKPLSDLVFCCGKSAVCRVCQFVVSRPGAAARRSHSFFEYSSCVGLL